MKVTSEFAWRMENVLDLYEEAFDPLRPIICLDETPYQLLADKLEPIPMQPGQSKRQDYEYERKGVASLFIMYQPHTGWRQVVVKERRTKADFADIVRNVVDRWFPGVESIRLVLDNLNTHSPGSLYSTFDPVEAHRLTKMLKFHYTPKHASWLNMAEIEISALQQQCLDRRIPDTETLKREIDAWQRDRNHRQVKVNWQFTTEKARVKLARFYNS